VGAQGQIHGRSVDEAVIIESHQEIAGRVDSGADFGGGGATAHETDPMSQAASQITRRPR